MNKNLDQLIEVSRYFGSKEDFVIAGGGNTSYKDEEKIWVKASGTSLDEISLEEFAVLDREKLQAISGTSFSSDPQKRELQVKEAHAGCLIDRDIKKRPSVETSLHELIQYKYVVHTHPNLVNGLMCSKKAGSIVKELFEETILFIPYNDPGYTLYKVIERNVLDFRGKHNMDPKIIFLENHGVFVSSDSTREIKEIYHKIISTLENRIVERPVIDNVPIPESLTEYLPAIRSIYQADSFSVVRLLSNSFILPYTISEASFLKISKPLTPDMVVYCKKEWMYIENTNNAKSLIKEFRKKLNQFEQKNQCKPKIVVLKKIGVLGFESDSKSAEIVLKIFEDLAKVCHYSEFFGGAKPLTDSQIEFIDTWEVENYRRKVSKEILSGDSAKKMVAVVTGGAQGFGRGICESLFMRGSDVVIADVNSEKGKELENHLNSQGKHNRAFFSKSDISDPADVKKMMARIVAQFGGLDLLVSNAGILKAGSLEEMDAETFGMVTKINYEGYFNCTKAASEIFKLQHTFNPNVFYDIIQINSKSGLKGSNKNFAYSGSKFGGVGLTQSFALELIDYKIKVNSICPGNYFDGPLWSDPEDGLFIQYLKAGKVPGAQSVEDVRRHYEKQVPFGRGCEVDDVMKAIWYVIEQKYETGQAIPVTGGQIMIN